MAKENFFKKYPVAKHLLLMLGISALILILVFINGNHILHSKKQILKSLLI